MCRLGFGEGELERLARADLDALELRLVMSHLACAEEAGNPMNQQQLARFERLRAAAPAAPASLANSSGIFLGPAFHYQLCRPGVALYGVNPTPGRANPMTPVVTLEAPVLQVHEVGAPGSVGYGATYRTACRRPDRDRAGRLRRRLSARGERSRRRPASPGTEVPLAGPGVDGSDQPGRLGAAAERGPPRHHGRADRRPGRRRRGWPRRRAPSATKC